MYNKAKKQHQRQQQQTRTGNPTKSLRSLSTSPSVQFWSQPAGALLAPGGAGLVMTPPRLQGALCRSSRGLPRAVMADTGGGRDGLQTPSGSLSQCPSGLWKELQQEPWSGDWNAGWAHNGLTQQKLHSCSWNHRASWEARGVWLQCCEKLGPVAGELDRGSLTLEQGRQRGLGILGFPLRHPSRWWSILFLQWGRVPIMSQFSGCFHVQRLTHSARSRAGLGSGSSSGLPRQAAARLSPSEAKRARHLPRSCA